MFELKNVTKTYGNEHALKNVSLMFGKGLNFIVGASGSGKTTLLKLISGMESSYEGSVTCCGKEMSSLSPKETSYFYNNVFGFVWQDFNLIDDATVMENVLLPQYLKKTPNKKNAQAVLKDLKLSELSGKKVKLLSGGEKQRVAIARELLKHPQVLLADEPTSALDKESCAIIMNLLRKISKTKTVIIVTHDTSLITPADNCYELDKGELISQTQVSSQKLPALKPLDSQRLSVSSSFQLALTNIKNKPGRFAAALLSLLTAGVLLLTTVSGTISNSGQGEFEKLLGTYGDSLLDISLIDSFTDASGTDGKEDEKSSGDVSQDISGLYDLYVKDKRVAFVAYLQAFDNIKIKADGKEYKIESSGNSPSINKLVAGEMPDGKGNEVVIPESFLKALGVTANDALGKEIDFNGSVYDWSTGSPVSKNTDAKVTIVGVMDTTITYDSAGETQKFVLEDAFLFSKHALSEMLAPTGIAIEKLDFFLRAETPADMIAIKDELNEKGLVPLGRFELVEDMVRLNAQTSEQSGSAGAVIGLLALVMVFAIYLLTGLLRRKEYAVCKVSGFHNAHLLKLNLAETFIYALSTILLLLVFSPLISLATQKLFAIDILTAAKLTTGIAMILLSAVLAFAATTLTFYKISVSTSLNTGDR